MKFREKKTGIVLVATTKTIIEQYENNKMYEKVEDKIKTKPVPVIEKNEDKESN